MTAAAGRVFAWCMRLAGRNACALPDGQVRDALDLIASGCCGGGARVAAVIFESAALEGFMWQLFGVRVMGLSSGLIRRFMRRGGDCPEFKHVVRHELEHCRRGHWLCGALGNALVMLGERLTGAGGRIIAALEEEADGYERRDSGR